MPTNNKLWLFESKVRYKCEDVKSTEIDNESELNDTNEEIKPSEKKRNNILNNNENEMESISFQHSNFLENDYSKDDYQGPYEKPQIINKIYKNYNHGDSLNQNEHDEMQNVDEKQYKNLKIPFELTERESSYKTIESQIGFSKEYEKEEFSSEEHGKKVNQKATFENQYEDLFYNFGGVYQLKGKEKRYLMTKYIKN